MITAKVKLGNKVVQAEGTEHEQVQLVFSADYADGRNKEWSRYTPSLSLTMSVLPEVADRFEPGQAYTLTFERTE
jgi:predicted RNA-binding protein with PIN domain